MTRARGFAVFATVLGLAAASSAVEVDPASSYGHLRIVEGTVWIEQGAGPLDSTVNRPVLTGDEVSTDSDSRTEMLLPDRNRLRLGEGAMMRLDALAGSRDGVASSTVLVLDRGEVQITTAPDAIGEAPVRIDLPDAIVYLDAGGRYGLGAWAEGSSLVVRDGEAQIVTLDSERRVERGLEIWVSAEGDGVSARGAGKLSELEAWGQALDRGGTSSVSYAHSTHPSGGQGYEGVTYWGGGLSPAEFGAWGYGLYPWYSFYGWTYPFPPRYAWAIGPEYSYRGMNQHHSDSVNGVTNDSQDVVTTDTSPGTTDPQNQPAAGAGVNGGTHGRIVSSARLPATTHTAATSAGNHPTASHRSTSARPRSPGVGGQGRSSGRSGYSSGSSAGRTHGSVSHGSSGGHGGGGNG